MSSTGADWGEAGGQEYTDPEGATWTRRGRASESVPGKQLRRLLADPKVRVIFDRWQQRHEIPASGRDAFWARVQSATGDGDYMACEYKRAQDEHLVVIFDVS